MIDDHQYILVRDLRYDCLKESLQDIVLITHLQTTLETRHTDKTWQKIGAKFLALHIDPSNTSIVEIIDIIAHNLQKHNQE